MRVLVTGAAGFIGSHICIALVEAGHEVVGTDAMLDSAHGPVDPPADVGRLDVRDAAGLEQALNGIDVVCHQAAVVGAGVSQQDAPAYAAHNDLGTATLLAAMDRTGCRRLVLASSMVVYGDGRYRSGEPNCWRCRRPPPNCRSPAWRGGVRRAVGPGCACA